MQKRTTGFFMVVVAAFGMSPPVVADTTAEDAKGYRVSIMTSLKGHIGATSMMVRGLVDDHGQLAAHADGLANGIAEMQYIFQEGSIVDDSEALPVIWEQPEKFSAAIQNAAPMASLSPPLTASLNAAVASAAFWIAAENFSGCSQITGNACGDSEAIGAAFRNVGMSCRGCHDDFRVAHD